jgi:hypothetical protein
MPNNFELVATLSVGAIFAASATALYPTVEKSWEFAKVAEKVREMPFTKFCGTDGSILSGSGRMGTAPCSGRSPRPAGPEKYGEDMVTSPRPEGRGFRS